ncbi:DUF445 family (YjiN) [Commensalibacter communis]|uniref:DUF445 family (YjiN) n=1 Tax=Commensalibacter communis TaxID=2972786 RepID=A0A9W4TN82_9PROT|nr:DUF445 domain-containing protein [Commensalibacter communis]CAI3922389.1 DUF445 family (YjiN) [Commensalibacter communis]CAI3929641.1 DUF445 family (YjiN) [Commensalibacter communis]CAI3930218.1 DUF445 family (YjiN) [Commensalibacter communis]CAI3931262.1 DUF445 family (YjiN) [Commensalibacter communis]CAI3932791.1 DUF445 family (YjiN) [Commensalibacter communis]
MQEKVENTEKTSESDHLAWVSFIRYRRIATGLLMLMGILTFLGYLLPYYGIIHDSFLLNVFRTGAQAGFIGGFADWFAVTALFRHPMGLPIPHTAILPMQQKRLGKGLGYFIARYVFTKDEVKDTLNKIDFPSLIARYLSNPTNIDVCAKIIMNSVPNMLDRFEDGRASTFVSRIFSRLLSGESLSPLMVRSLRTMVDNEHHQEIVSFLLEVIKKNLKEKEDSLKEIIQDRVKEQGGRFLGWMIGGSVASKVLLGINKEMDRIDPQNSDLRHGIAEWIKKEIDKFETNPERSEKISEALKIFVDHESVQDWREDIWQKIRTLVEEDIENDDGWMKNLIHDTLLYLATQLREDPSVREKVTATLQGAALRSLPHTQQWLVDFTENVVAGWDSKALVSRLETRIGKDLQFIRINGSIVGFLVGIIIYLFIYVCFGSVT